MGAAKGGFALVKAVMRVILRRGRARISHRTGAVIDDASAQRRQLRQPWSGVHEIYPFSSCRGPALVACCRRQRRSPITRARWRLCWTSREMTRRRRRRRRSGRCGRRSAWRVSRCDGYQPQGIGTGYCGAATCGASVLCAAAATWPVMGRGAMRAGGMAMGPARLMARLVAVPRFAMRPRICRQLALAMPEDVASIKLRARCCLLHMRSL